jgi:hypothetical protein
MSDNQVSFFPPELAKYGIEWDFMKLNDSFVALVATCWMIQSQIEAAKKESASDTVKVATHPYDVKASKDKKAAAKAAELLKAFIAACDAAISTNKNVAWHLAETDSAVTAYLTSEMQYHRFKESPAKPATAGTKLDELRKDRYVLTNLAKMFVGGQPLLANDPRLILEDGKVKLPNLQGAGGGNTSNVPTGRGAGYKRATWIIDGKKYPIGTDPRELVRVIWVGIERVGKKPSDIFDVMTAKVKAEKLTLKQRENMTFTINGKVIQYIGDSYKEEDNTEADSES